MPIKYYDKLLREAKEYLKGSRNNEDGHQIQYDSGYVDGIKDAKSALAKDAKPKDEAFDAMLEALKDFIAAGTMDCCCGETPCCGTCTITMAKNAVAKAESV